MLEYLYEFWQLLLGISVFIGVISGIVGFRRQIRVKKGQLIVRILFSISIMVVTASCIVGLTFSRVPKLVGYTVHEAEQELIDRDLKIGLQSNLFVNSDTRNYIVIEQDYHENDLVIKGTMVTVYLDLTETDKILVAVPNVIGMEQDVAVRSLLDSNLRFKVWWTEEDDVSSECYYIINQSIPAGTVVPAETQICLELSSSLEEKILD